MRTPITVRIEAELLAAARRCAARENRTLTNFIETVLRHRIEEMTSCGPPSRVPMSRQAENGPSDAA